VPPPYERRVSWELRYSHAGILSQRGGTERFRLDMARLHADPHVVSLNVTEDPAVRGYDVLVQFVPGVGGPQNPALWGLNDELNRNAPLEWGHKTPPPVYEGEVDHDWKPPEPPKTVWDRIMQDDESDLDDPG